jgi:putative multiple sugar transport system substrate-binding protein
MKAATWKGTLAAVAFGVFTTAATAVFAQTVGISMPTRDNERWIRESDKMTEVLKGSGYGTEVQFANNDVATQVNQIENLITKGVDALVICSVDGSALSSVLDEAKSKNIPVIAYTRLISGTDAVTYYTTFDYYKYGQVSAQAILQGLGVVDASGKATDKKGPFNVEYIGGSPTDNVARYQYNAAVDTFKPYIDSGVLKVGSGQTSFEQTATVNWDGGAAQSRMENILASTYTDGTQVNAVWVPYDGLTRGVISALQDAGYTVGQNWPILPGGDAEIDSVKAILNGEQYSTAFTDYRGLAGATGKLVAELLHGDKPTGKFDTETYNNGNKVVPTMLFDVINVKKDDVVPVLVDSGFYTKSQIGLQ